MEVNINRYLVKYCPNGLVTEKIDFIDEKVELSHENSQFKVKNKKNIIILSKINGMNGTYVGHNGFRGNILESVEIQDSFISIDDYAFEDDELICWED